MKKNSKLVSALVIILAVSAEAQRAHAATVSISLSPPAASVSIGQSFSVDINADIAAPIVAWGVNLVFDSNILTLDSNTVGAAWFPASGSRPGDLAGIAFPSPVTGLDVLLTRLNFTAVGTGQTILTLSIDPNNLTEGFPLLAGTFADFTLGNGFVTVNDASAAVPEPSTSALMISIAVFFLFIKLRRPSIRPILSELKDVIVGWRRASRIGCQDLDYAATNINSSCRASLK
jgi:hypothetical protein